MAYNRSTVKATPSFVSDSTVDELFRFINTHGVYARILQARKCPCLGDRGSPDNHCSLCGGDGFFTKFQRNLLQIDENLTGQIDANDPSIVYPFFNPISKPVRVERLLSQEQGGDIAYSIDGWDSQKIRISGGELPRKFDPLRVSYYMDRLTPVEDDLLSVNGDVATAPGCNVPVNVYEGADAGLTGDIAEITSLYAVDANGGRINLSAVNVSGNRIRLKPPLQDLSGAKVYASYLKADPEKVLIGDLNIRDQKEKQWTEIPQGTVKMGLMPWWDLSQGDLITLLGPEFPRDEVVLKSNDGIDYLHEFDVARAVESIVARDGAEYNPDEDFTIIDRRTLKWVGRTPAPGMKFTIRYLYRPTYAVFQDNPTPAYFQNKRFPKSFPAALYSMMGKEPTQKNQFSQVPVLQTPITPFDFVAQYSKGPQV